MPRPRLLLVPEFTELTWTIRPSLEEWAEVASFDTPGVGDEPLPSGDPSKLTLEVIVTRGLEEIERRRWERFFVVADGWTIGVAARIADRRCESVAGVALGHARLSHRRHGERPPVTDGVWQAMTQLLRQDHEAFVRYGIVQSTAGSVDEHVAQQMVERFPKELTLLGWERITAEDPELEPLLRGLRCPLLLAKHEGCLSATDEGFEDAVAALPGARATVVPDAPSTSAEFAGALRSFCEELWSSSGATEPRAAGEPLSGADG